MTRDESLELLTRQSTKTKVQLSVKLTGKDADIWNELLARSELTKSNLIKTAIREYSIKNSPG